MAETTSTAEMWMQRVDAWRASGMRAEVFSEQAGYPAGTLRWWASRLKRALAAPSSAPKPRRRANPAEVRLARIVRPAVTAVSEAGAPVVLELARSGVRVVVPAGTDRTTLVMVLESLGVACGARP